MMRRAKSQQGEHGGRETMAQKEGGKMVIKRWIRKSAAHLLSRFMCKERKDRDQRAVPWHRKLEGN